MATPATAELDASEPLASAPSPTRQTPAAELLPPARSAPAPDIAHRTLLTGASALIFATGMERGFGFLANLLAARLGGAAVFGAYSLAMTTANNIAAYAGAGIGSTATRFSGQYDRGTAGSRMLARALVLVSVTSAALAGLALLAGSGPLARTVLRQPGLTPLLAWASLSAAVLILFECCRGFLVGQRRLGRLVLFSLVMGSGMLALLPFMSRWGAIPMVWTQAGVASLAIALVLIGGQTGLEKDRPDTSSQDVSSHDKSADESVAHMARRVWSFGFVQLLGIIGLNAAGWWIASVVARSDATLVEMGLFAVANQVRNIAGLAPGLLTQSSYALLAREDAAPDRIVVFCTFTTALLLLLLAGLGIVVLPWLLPLAWGKGYSAGVLAGSLALATAVVHMANSPAAARLTIVSLPLTGVINAIWSVAVVLLSFLFLSGTTGNAAAIAMAIYLAAHLLSAVLVFAALRHVGHVAEGLGPLLVIVNGAAISLGGLSWLGWRHGAGREAALVSGAELLTVIVACAAVLAVGRRRGFRVGSVWTAIEPAIGRVRGMRTVRALLRGSAR